MDKFCQDRIDRAATTSNSRGAVAAKDEMLDVGKFVEALGPKVQGVNLLEVDKYLRESKIARKVSPRVQCSLCPN